MKISLIGASGFVDSSLLELIKQNYNSLQNINKQQSIFHKEITTVVNVFDKKLLKKTPILQYCLPPNTVTTFPLLHFTTM